MLRSQEMVPDYYIEQSRDFQVLCRLIDFQLNALKFNIDTMQSLTDTSLVKDNILPLVGDKFGIYDKQSYANRELLTALPMAVHYKGSLKSISLLLNAYLDSRNIFDYAVAYHTKDEESAKEISDLLRRDIKPYTIVIVLSTTPSLTDLHVLNEYLRMVVPCGMFIEYIFGVSEVVLDKFKYVQNVFVYYTSGEQIYTVASKDTNYKAINKVTARNNDRKAFVETTINNIDVNVVGAATIKGKED